jgi:hypothetical protein
LQGVINELFPGADMLIAHFFAGTFSNAQPEVLASDLEREIDKANKVKDYKRILLVGHNPAILRYKRSSFPVGV